MGRGEGKRRDPCPLFVNFLFLFLYLACSGQRRRLDGLFFFLHFFQRSQTRTLSGCSRQQCSSQDLPRLGGEVFTPKSLSSSFGSLGPEREREDAVAFCPRHHWHHYRRCGAHCPQQDLANGGKVKWETVRGAFSRLPQTGVILAAIPGRKSQPPETGTGAIGSWREKTDVAVLRMGQENWAGINTSEESAGVLLEEVNLWAFPRKEDGIQRGASERKRIMSTTLPTDLLNAKTHTPPLLVLSIPASVGTFDEGLCSFIYVLLLQLQPRVHRRAHTWTHTLVWACATPPTHTHPAAYNLPLRPYPVDLSSFKNYRQRIYSFGRIPGTTLTFSSNEMGSRLCKLCCFADKTQRRDLVVWRHGLLFLSHFKLAWEGS